jgi:hypothetical protein
VQHVAPLKHEGVKHIQARQQHGQLHHVLLASTRSTLSSPSVSRRVQGVLRKPAKVALLHMVYQQPLPLEIDGRPTSTGSTDE